MKSHVHALTDGYMLSGLCAIHLLTIMTVNPVETIGNKNVVVDFREEQSLRVILHILTKNVSSMRIWLKYRKYHTQFASANLSDNTLIADK